jgi:site-specific DNA recombinase
MLAAIYARKSTQKEVADEQKSVARQIEHARQYAQRKGWTVADEHVYIDDGISGAEFANRPGFLRLMNALKPRPAFQVLIMSEESRLGREAIETAYALKQLVTAGVRVFFYLEDRERTLESPTDKIMLSLTAFADELERERARQRVYDAMTRKARALHVTGNQCFGYRNVDVTAPGPDGRMHRQYVRREVLPEEAAVIRRIFELCASGEGLKGITKTLNTDRTPAPRSQRGRPKNWAPSSVREILYRESYRGTVVWNKTRKRDSWGHKRQTDRPSSEWLRVEAESLRIVPEALWQAAHARLTQRRENYRIAGWRAPDGRGVRRHYLLSGFARCTVCGGSMQAVSRASTTGRLFRYVCASYWNRGASVCANGRMANMETADGAVRELLASEVLQPAVIERALDRAVAMLRTDQQATGRATRRAELTRRLAALDAELANLADTAARGGAVPVILQALTRKDVERRAIAGELATLREQEQAATPMDVRALRRTLRGYLDDWHAMIRGNVAEARRVFDVVLRDRIRFRPVDGEDGRPNYELTLPIAFDRMLATVIPILQVRVASPTGFEPVFRP